MVPTYTYTRRAARDGAAAVVRVADRSEEEEDKRTPRTPTDENRLSAHTRHARAAL